MENNFKSKKGNSNFLKKAFSLEYVSIPLSVFSLVLSLLVVFMPLASYTLPVYKASISLFFIAFIFSLSGIIIEFIKNIKNDKSSFNVQLAISMFSLFIVCIIAPLTINAYSFII